MKIGDKVEIVYTDIFDPRVKIGYTASIVDFLLRFGQKTQDR